MSAIIITGASSGIGQALAVHYAAPGVTLGLSGRALDRLESVAALCRARGAIVSAAVLDVRDRAAMHEWITAFDSQFGLDLLVANAGVGGNGALEPTAQSLAAARDLFAVNIEGVLNTVDPALPLMAARGHGQIALMASLAGFRGLAGAPAYAASKGFVRVYGEGLRGACAPFGVSVSVICPGFVESRITGLNAFPMPFFMKADRAARIIAAGLKKKKARIAFPPFMLFAVWLLAAMPASLSERISASLPKKG